jgi:hypothetical protein
VPSAARPGVRTRAATDRLERLSDGRLLYHLRRVFALDLRVCPDCGGRMRILAAIHVPEATRAILQCLGLP